jgi:adenylate cyclase
MSDSPKAFLKLIAGGEENTWPLAGKSTYRVERGEGSDILLPYSWVSRQHAMIQMEANFSHNIVDLGSANGTFVNGRRVYTPTRLSSNDHVKIGKSELVFLQEKLVAAQSGDETRATGDETVAFLQKNQVTILVCDIRQFTPLSEEVGADTVSQFLALWTKKVDGIVQKNGGQVDKFIVDAVLAVWPDGGDFAAVAMALFSALEITILTCKLGQSVPGISRELKIGAALNSGEAVMGNIGLDGQRDFTIAEMWSM